MKGDHRMEIIGVYIFAIPTWWSINKRKKVLYTWYLKHYWFMTVDLKAERNFNWKHKHQAWRPIMFVCLMRRFEGDLPHARKSQKPRRGKKKINGMTDSR